MNYKLPTLLILIATILLSGCLEPNPDMPPLEQTSYDAEITSVEDVTSLYPQVAKFKVGWYTAPREIYFKSKEERSRFQTTFVFLVTDKSTDIKLISREGGIVTSGDAPSLFNVPSKSYDLRAVGTKRMFRINIDIDTLERGNLHLTASRYPPFIFVLR